MPDGDMLMFSAQRLPTKIQKAKRHVQSALDRYQLPISNDIVSQWADKWRGEPMEAFEKALQGYATRFFDKKQQDSVVLSLKKQTKEALSDHQIYAILEDLPETGWLKSDGTAVEAIEQKSGWPPLPPGIKEHFLQRRRKRLQRLAQTVGITQASGFLEALHAVHTPLLRALQLGPQDVLPKASYHGVGRAWLDAFGIKDPQILQDINTRLQSFQALNIDYLQQKEQRIQQHQHAAKDAQLRAKHHQKTFKERLKTGEEMLAHAWNKQSFYLEKQDLLPPREWLDDLLQAQKPNDLKKVIKTLQDRVLEQRSHTLQSRLTGLGIHTTQDLLQAYQDMPTGFETLWNEMHVKAWTGASTTARIKALLMIFSSKPSSELLKEAAQRLEAHRLKRLQHEEERRQKQQEHLEWERGLLSVADTQHYLEATSVELHRWIKDGRVEVAKHKTFRRWGKTLQTSLHDPKILENIKGQLPLWRLEDSKRLRHTSILATQTSQSEERRIRAWADLCKALQKGEVLAKNGDLFLSYPWTVPIWPHAFNNPSILLHIPLQDQIHADWAQHTKAAIEGRLHALDRLSHPFLQAWALRVKAVQEAYTKASDQRYFSLMLHRMLQEPQWPASLEIDQVVQTLPSLLENSLAKAISSFRAEYQPNDIRKEVGLDAYPAMFPVARSLPRKLRLLVGPTNSGKTYEALNRLAQAKTGVYLAPLRLMALEGAENLQHRGVLAHMRTGEEHIAVEGARHTSSTIEMLNTEETVEVAVIDEIQIITDPHRGWAWTQAVIGAPAKEVIMTGSPDAIPVIVKLAQLLGEELEVQTFARKTPLQALKHPVPLSQIQKGDAVIAFSRAQVLDLRDSLHKMGHKVSCIYGALGPDVRRAEAARFREGLTDVVVATDAIGMGLNLPVGRVLFSALKKYDGFQDRPLEMNEIRQIAGRAGRFGLKEQGFAGILQNAGSGFDIQKALSSPNLPITEKPFLQAPWRAIEAVGVILATDDLVHIMEYAHQKLLHQDPHFQGTDLTDTKKVAWAIAKSGLSLRTRYSYLGCPIDGRSGEALEELQLWARLHGHQSTVPCPEEDFEDIPKTRDELQHCEQLVKRLTLYLWLSLRWPEVYPDRQHAQDLRTDVNLAIEKGLRQKALKRW